MRRVNLQLPQGAADEALAVAADVGGVNVSSFAARTRDGPVDVVVAHVPNDRVEELLRGVEPLGDVRVTLEPDPVIPLRPPIRQAADELLDTAPRSPLEVLLAGMSSAGTWGSFLGYAGIAGAVVAAGLYTETAYLLTAAMLIAPFAGPAMNAAIATAVGEPDLLRHALARYVASVLTTAAVAGLVAVVVGLEVPTPLMVAVGSLSPLAVMLPLAAGTAGALHLVQSERSSLVSGAAVGMLVAASLAPPAGIAGMAVVAGRWDLVGRGAFVLLLQLVGIHLVATTLFRYYRLDPSSRWIGQGQWRVLPIGLAATGVVLVGLLALQTALSPTLVRVGVERDALVEVRELITDDAVGEVVDADIRFAPYDDAGPLLLVGLELSTEPGADVDERAVEERVRDALRQRFETAVAVDVTTWEVAR